MGYAKVIHKKKKKMKDEKNEHKSVWDIKNNGYLDARLKKRENKNSPYSCKYLKFQQERYVFKEHSRIRLATKSSTHMHILIWLYDSTLFGSNVWLYNIWIASML